MRPANERPRLAYAACLGLLFAMAAAIAAGQIAIAPHTALPAGVSAPLLGYVSGMNPGEIVAVTGTAGRPKLGEKLAFPARVYLPPRQFYVVIEGSANAPMTVQTLDRKTPSAQPLPGAMPHPDLVTFSPGGEAAALFSQGEERLQMVAHLPLQPVIVASLATAGRGSLSAIAITDDASLLVVQFNGGAPLYSFAARPWQLVSTGYQPQAWSFLPHSHDLVMSDPGEKAIVLLPNLNETPVAARTVASLAADRLAVTKDGTRVLAGVAGSNTAFSIDLASGDLAHLATPGPITSLTPLRDGQTFLVSASPNLRLLKAAPPAQLVP